MFAAGDGDHGLLGAVPIARRGGMKKSSKPLASKAHFHASAECSLNASRSRAPTPPKHFAAILRLWRAPAERIGLGTQERQDSLQSVRRILIASRTALDSSDYAYELQLFTLGNLFFAERFLRRGLAR